MAVKVSDGMGISMSSVLVKDMRGVHGIRYVKCAFGLGSISNSSVLAWMEGVMGLHGIIGITRLVTALLLVVALLIELV